MPTKKLSTRYEHDLKLLPDLWHKVGLLLALAFLLPFPLLASGYWLGVANFALITIVGAVGLMILTGFTGQISLGHAAFLGLGAYTAALLGQAGLPFWLVLPAAGLVAAVVGLAVGPFALRLKGLYLAIVTIGLLLLVNHCLISFPELTGGVGGIAVPTHAWFGEPNAVITEFQKAVELGSLRLTFEKKLYYLFALVALLSILAGKNLHRSNSGRALMAVRDHDLAAAALGVNPARAKITAFGISSFFGGVAGAMFAFQQQFITVDPPFGFLMSIEYVAIVVVGGTGTIFGAVAGAIFFVVVAPLTELVGPLIPYFSELTNHQQATFLFAVVVSAFLLFEPLGLLGIWLRVKRYFALWPFRY
ncbi:MAG: branched-chain amino acid ABC transporter permease [Deltaproteobacteria bacterium]|nr:branched-chain amino acid ABC transporter permease [Deltaproteobacteria bacterium]